MNSRKTLTIHTGPQRGTWQQIKATGFGSDGTRSGWVKLGKRGQPLTTGHPSARINLTPAQVAQVEQQQ